MTHPVQSQPALAWMKTTYHMAELQPVRGAHGAAAWTHLRKGNSYWGQETQEVAWEGSREDARREVSPKEKEEGTWKKAEGEARGRGHCWRHAGDALF